MEPFKEGDTLTINNVSYEIIKLLGHGKGGYSYLVKNKSTYFVLKKIHHEPCSYYQFGNKIEAELNDYERLLKTGIRIPKMISFDKDEEIIIKEYIEGETIKTLVDKKENIQKYIDQLSEFLPLLYSHNLNIDYYPTNFIVNIKDDLIYYIDYECNNYDPKWDFENWGKAYWIS